MTYLTTNCPSCGEIDLPLDEVVLRVNDDDGTGACVVRCPACGARLSKEADDPMMILLVAAGVEVETWTRPAEVDERPEGLEPLTHADLVAFGAALDSGELDVDWFARGPAR